MNKTKIEWADMTWNPVTGCYHNCPYCYARNIAKRFGGFAPEENPPESRTVTETPYGILLDLCEDGGQAIWRKNGKCVLAPYPFDFVPTFHRYRLNEPQYIRKPQNIFVCSMADLFGAWVPGEWIETVFEACATAPQHRYLFLTKNPKRYVELYEKAILPTGDNYWYGSTCTAPSVPVYYSRMPDDNPHTFISVEPLLEPFGNIEVFPDWVIIGAETGNRRGKVTPGKEWIESIANQARERNIPVFMKDSLVPVVGESGMIREFPWKT